MNNSINIISNGKDIATFFFDDGEGRLFENCCDIQASLNIQRDVFRCDIFGEPYSNYVEGPISSSVAISFFSDIPKFISLSEGKRISPKEFSSLSVLEIFEIINKKLDRRDSGNKNKINHTIPVFVSNGEKLVLFTKEMYVSVEKPLLTNMSVGVFSFDPIRTDLRLQGNGKCEQGYIEDLDFVTDFSLDGKTVLGLLEIADDKIRSRNVVG